MMGRRGGGEELARGRKNYTSALEKRARREREPYGVISGRDIL